MGLQDIATPVSVARSVLERSVHNVLVGEGARKWAVSQGYSVCGHSTDAVNVLTEKSREEWLAWKRAREGKNKELEQIEGKTATSSSSYSKNSASSISGVTKSATKAAVVVEDDDEDEDEESHDTVGVICLDAQGRLACGTSTSGWKFKHPGRVGDSPLVGSGLYCDGRYGAAVATGDGEEVSGKTRLGSALVDCALLSLSLYTKRVDSMCMLIL
jgi:N4-(beta-N-acetylglucosaminyl)-L-asparaginase